MTGLSPWLAHNTHAIVAFVATLCTLGLYSMLYKENKVYRFFEHVYLGLAVGYLVAQTWTDVLHPKWWTPLSVHGDWWQIFVMAIGLFYYFIYSKKYNWLARLVIGFFLGVAGGQTFQGFYSDTWPQIQASLRPVVPHQALQNAQGHIVAAAVSWPEALNNIIFTLILLLVMSYFFFSFELKSPIVKGITRSGRWLLMFSFGAIFGSTIMARLALLIDRVDYLLNDFGPYVGGPKVVFWGLVVIIVAILAVAARSGDSLAGNSSSETSDS